VAVLAVRLRSSREHSARHEPHWIKRPVVSVDGNEQDVEVISWPERTRADVRNELTLRRNRLRVTGARLDLNRKGRAALPPVKNEVDSLVIYEARRDVEFKTADQDARCCHEMLDGFPFAR
jgi:hypothetical protein